VINRAPSRKAYDVDPFGSWYASESRHARYSGLGRAPDAGISRTAFSTVGSIVVEVFIIILGISNIKALKNAETRKRTN
jgi:hypothetical protein